MSIASELIRQMIVYCRESNHIVREASAIVSQGNTASRLMMEKNKFIEIAKWDYYSGYRGALQVDKDYLSTCDTYCNIDDRSVSFATPTDLQETVAFLSGSQTFISSGRRCVRSWKWCVLDSDQMLEFIRRGQIVIVRNPDNNQLEGLATTSNNFYDIHQGVSEQEPMIEREDDNSSFQIGYLDVQGLVSLEALMKFLLRVVILSDRFKRIQVFAPCQVFWGKPYHYEMSQELSKFGIDESECFLLYSKRI